MHKTIIWSPAYYRKSAGIRACHVLCEELRKRGIEAYIQSILGLWQPSPYDAPALRLTSGPDLLYNYAHIYPECLFDAPTGIKRMPLRNNRTYWWILSPRIPKQETDLPMLFWDPVYGGTDLLGVDVFMPYFHPNPHPVVRSGIAVYEGKGRIDQEQVFAIQEQHAPSETIYWITKTGMYSFEDRHEDMADVFRKVKFTVTFDDMSAANGESLLCGAPVYCTVKKSRFLNPFGRFGLPGMTDDLSRISELLVDERMAYDVWQQKKQGFSLEIDRLVSRIQQE